MELSSEQEAAYNLYLRGHNVFVTGPGGTGKSALIKKIYDHATSNHRLIHVTALTGCAAVLLGCKASTLHSWAGIGLGNAPFEELVTKLQKNKFKRANWLRTQILVVDEVSMLSLKLFQLLDDIGKVLRRSSRPFGGIQLIFSGDFFQLPPVGKEEDPESSQFCFESSRFFDAFPHQIELKKIFRQDDETYITILNQIREGIIKKSSNDLLLSLTTKQKPEDVVVTRLYPKRYQVDAINAEKMGELDGVLNRFELRTHTDLPMTKDEKRLRDCFTHEEVQMELEFVSNSLLCDRLVLLKKGSQVMCVVNMKEEGIDILCNGSQGIVQDFCEITKAPIVKFNNGIIKTMTRYTWVSDKIPGVGVSQVPLILAWALTIHKSQGSTLDMAEVDVGSGIFECGQTYVALSRVKNLKGLFLTSFDHTKIRVFRKVKAFYETLRSNSTAVEEKDPNIKVIKL